MRYHTIITVLILFSIHYNSIAQVNQSWVKHHSASNNQGYGHDMAKDIAGNIYVCSMDFAVIKYNPQGEVIWTREYPGAEAKSIAIDQQGNIYVTGPSNDLYLTILTIKYNSSGDMIWQNFYSDPQNRYLDLYAPKLVVDNSANVYISLNIYLDPNAETQGMLNLKINQNGSHGWAKTYSHPTGFPYAESKSIAVDNSGNSYVTGFTYTTLAGENGYDFVLIKYNTLGEEQWVKIENGPANQNDIGQCVLISANGEIYVGGAITTEIASFIQFDIALFKYDANGNRQFMKLLDVNGYSDVIYDMTFDNSANIILTGYCGSLNSFLDIITAKFNSSGDLQWYKTYNGSHNNWDEGRAVTTDNFGNIYVTGAAWENSTDLDYTTIKYSPSGTQLWFIQYDGGQNWIDVPRAIEVVNNNDVYVTGYSSTRNGTSSATTVKYSQVVGINPVSNEIPTEFHLYNNYPNPFNPATTINFDIPVNTNVKLVIYDIIGAETETLLNKILNAGKYSLNWEGTSSPSGVYFYRLTAGEYTETKKMMLVK